MRARELMTPEPECVTPDDTLTRAAEVMKRIDVGFVPVVDDTSGRELRGVITDRDIAVRHVAERHDGECTVGDHMTSDNIEWVGPDDETDDVMRRMRARQVRRVPVLEDGRRLVGVIAQADLAVETPDRMDEEVEETVERISEPAQPAR